MSQVYSQNQAEEFNFELPEFEVDSSEDLDFGTLYRVWKSWNLVGTFYQDLNGKWVAQPTSVQVNGKFDTEEQVILAIMAAISNLVELEPNINSLLDKPFDELTAGEWQRLMAHSVHSDHLEVASA